MSVLRSVSDAVAFQASVFNSSSVHGYFVKNMHVHATDISTLEPRFSYTTEPSHQETAAATTGPENESSPVPDYFDEHFCTLEGTRRIVITRIASKKEQMIFVPADCRTSRICIQQETDTTHSYAKLFLTTSAWQRTPPQQLRLRNTEVTVLLLCTDSRVSLQHCSPSPSLERFRCEVSQLKCQRTCFRASAVGNVCCARCFLGQNCLQSRERRENLLNGDPGWYSFSSSETSSFLTLHLPWDWSCVVPGPVACAQLDVVSPHELNSLAKVQ
ncbi:hypothetical protein Anapl_03328 [Anas platyrhynchos]|uniref:Uncharacterized protein n=1 Tax=Anas platyrhynchos TaxID=8839 RepID=R0LH54_ANAPL|nr:hypothetical protein Anapl_03328 [Anas platyrhynchos]